MNTITIEFCAEDRARLDKLIELMEKQLTAKGSEALFTPIANGALVEATEMPQEAPKAEPEKSIDPKEKEAPAPVSAEKPSVTLEQIQQKVVQLAAGYGGAKKAKVRAIINDYGAKVSDLKDKPEKWTEVWERLIALESEA